MAIPAAPDVAGFRDAQARLRAALGVDAVFIVPASMTWPADTPVDPETGKPYDPFLPPETTVPAQEITLRCSFVHRPLVAADPAGTPIGPIDIGEAVLIIAAEDFAGVRDATRVRVGEETFDIQLFRHDLALTVPRWLAYLEHA